MTYVPTPIDYEGSDADRLPDMGQKVNTNLSDIEAEFDAWMGSGVCGQFPYLATDFIGGTSGCLDNIDATDIEDGEKAIVVLGTTYPRLFFYRLKSPDTTTESSPEVIQPDTGGASKRWMLAGRTEKEPHMGASAPTANDDSADGYRVGDLWVYDDSPYFCVDDTVSAAIWITVGMAFGGEPGAVSSSTSGQAGVATTASRSDHNHDLGNHLHADSSSGGQIPHTNLTSVGANDHHNQSHTWEGGDHTGTLNEASVTFNTSTGHDHDGSDSKTIDHANLTNVTANQHHAQTHASAHASGQSDALDGDGIECSYSASNYTPTSSTIAGHYEGIDNAIAVVGGVFDVMGGRLVAASDIQLKWEFIESNQVTLWNDTTRTLVTLASAPTLANNANDLDSNPLASGNNYDIFLEYSSATAANLVAKKWTDATTRAVVPELYNGTIVYDADSTAGRKRRFVGTIRMASESQKKLVFRTWYEAYINHIGYSYRMVVSGDRIPFNIVEIRVGFCSPTAYSFYIDNASVVPRASGADGTTTPTSMLFSSNPYLNLSADSDGISDWTTFSSSAGVDLLVIFDVDSTTGYVPESTSNGDGGYYKSSTNSYDQQYVTGFTDGGANFGAGFYWVEIRSASGSTVSFRNDYAAQFISNFHHPRKKPLVFPNPYHASTNDNFATAWEQFLGGTDDWSLEYVHHGLEAEGLISNSNNLHIDFCATFNSSSFNATIGMGYNTSNPLLGAIFGGKFASYSPVTATLTDNAAIGYRKLYPLQIGDTNGSIHAAFGGACARLSGEIEG